MVMMIQQIDINSLVKQKQQCRWSFLLESIIPYIDVAINISDMCCGYNHVVDTFLEIDKDIHSSRKYDRFWLNTNFFTLVFPTVRIYKK